MARERSFRAEAIVLRRSDIGEADRLLTLFTKEQGKLRAIAKGARKPQSRKTGHVELFMRTQFLLATGRSMHIVTQAELLEPYNVLREDLIRTTYAGYTTELLDRFTTEEDRNVGMYRLMADTLSRLCSQAELRLVARYYELRLLSLAGFQPQLFRCVGSGDEIIEENQYFSAELGGLLKPDRRNQDRSARPISSVAIKVLRFLQTRPWEAVADLQLRPDLHRELEGVMFHYLTFLLERDLKSIDFLHRLRREAALFTDEEE